MIFKAGQKDDRFYILLVGGFKFLDENSLLPKAMFINLKDRRKKSMLAHMSEP